MHITVINQDILQNYIYYTGERILDQPKHKSEAMFKILVSKEKLVRKFTALRWRDIYTRKTNKVSES